MRAIIDMILLKLAATFPYFDHHLNKDDGKYLAIIKNEFQTVVKDFSYHEIKYAIEKCVSDMKTAPTIAEFKRLCEEATGLPDEERSFHLALRREFTHPVVKISFDRIGSWDFSRDRTYELRQKFKSAYAYACDKFRADRNAAWSKLEHDQVLAIEKTEQANEIKPLKCFSEMIKAHQTESTTVHHVALYDKIRKERADEAVRRLFVAQVSATQDDLVPQKLSENVNKLFNRFAVNKYNN